MIVVLECKSQDRWPMKGATSDQKAFKGPRPRGQYVPNEVSTICPQRQSSFYPRQKKSNNGRTWKAFHHPSQGQRTLPPQRPLHQLERPSSQECWKHPHLPRGLTPPSFCLVSCHLSDCCHWKKGVILEYPGYFLPAAKRQVKWWRRFMLLLFFLGLLLFFALLTPGWFF